MRDFRELEVWQAAHALTLKLYRATGAFPRQEMYGLTAQMRRAAVSIEANIAEGAGKRTRPDFARLLQIAFSSASELECELIIAKDLGFLPETDHCEFRSLLAERPVTGDSLETLPEGRRPMADGDS